MSTPPIVIIAELDPIISSVLRVEFSRLDFAVLLAASGLEAESYASQTVAHLVVLDTRLHLGAYDACARIRRLPGYADRPVVLTATEPSPKVRAAAERASATAVLEKPYSVDDLFNAIRPFVLADDLLLTHSSRVGGVNAPLTWPPAPPLTWESGGNSALSRNGQLLPIVRGNGVIIPLIRKPRP
ncbi:MAG TPA: response regulator [Rhodopila sp.]|jgi:CheY-like chemotaxis protein|nr:response regulator [Rhodopila sp.]